MKKIFTALFILMLIFQFSATIGQSTTYYAINTGLWNDPTIWSLTRAGSPAFATPGPNDDVFLDQNSVIITGSTIIRNIFLDDVTPNNLVLASSLQINGTLLCNSLNKWGFPFAGVSYPTIPGIIAPSGGSLIFTASATNTADVTLTNNEVIGFWSSLSPILAPVLFNFGSNPGSIGNIGSWGAPPNQFIPVYGDIDFAGNVTVQSGTLTTLQATMTGVRASGTFNSFTINSGSSLILTVPLTQNGTPTSLINTLIVNGTLDMTNGTTYANSTNFTLGSSGYLKTDFWGSNQQEGWWYQTSKSSITASGILEYSSPNNQNIFVVTSGLGDLILSGGGTKSLIGTGVLDISGNFNIGSAVTFTDIGQSLFIGGNFTNNSSYTPAVNVTFNGSTDQQITGLNLLSFGADLIIANSTGTVSLGTQNISLTGTLDIDPGSTFSPGNRNVTTTGNIIADGTLQAGTAGSTFIFDGTTNLSGSGASFNNFTINSSSSFISPAPGSINVAGNFDNNGTFNANNGTVIFNGIADQSITEIQDIEFRNIEIYNPDGAWVNVDGDVSITGTLTMDTTTAQFNADGAGSGNFILKSIGLNQDAQIFTLPNTNNFVGNVTVERTVNGVSNEATNWRYLAPPITNANVGMLQSIFPVTGNFSNPSTSSPETPIDDPSYPSIYYWDGATWPYWLFVGTGASTGATNLENGLGYSVYTYRTTDFTISYEGTIGKGSIEKNFAADAWALLGNPYPATIDWDLVYPGDGLGIYSAMYLRKDDGSYATYEEGSGGLNHPLEGAWDGEISSGQSFWIYSDGATSLTFSESDKTANPNYQFIRIGEPIDLIRITLSRDIQSDEILIRFADNVLDEFEPNNDALKLRNGDYIDAENMYSYINLSSYIVDSTETMAISAIPYVDDCDKTVYLKIEDVTEGAHALTFTNIDGFQMGYDITLIDNYTDERINVEENTEHIFQVTSDSASFGSNRFEVLFAAELIDRGYDYYTNSMCDQSYANVTVDNTVAGATYEIFKEGEMIGDPLLAENNQVTFQVPKSILAIGETIFNMNTNIGSCEAYIENAFIVEYDSVYEITNVEDGIGCGDELVILRANGAPLDGYYHWYENEMDDQPIPNETQSEFVINELDTTTTYYVSAVNALGCESALRKAVKGIVGEIPNGTPTADTPSSSCANSSATLVASGVSENGFYVWYDGNENIIKDENESSYVTPPLNDSSVFYVAFGNQFNCAGEKAMIEVPVIKLPKPTISEENGVLTSSYSSNNQWFMDDVKIEGATGTTYDTQLEGGSYTVEYSDNSCTVMSDPVNIEGVTGLDDIEESDLIKLFPNPASDNLYVEYNVPTESKIRLLIYTTGGRLVDSAYMDRYNNGHKTAINITGYAQGMYITVVFDGENYVYSKFRKQ